jgi:hypothetical protein
MPETPCFRWECLCCGSEHAYKWNWIQDVLNTLGVRRRTSWWGPPLCVLSERSGYTGNLVTNYFPQQLLSTHAWGKSQFIVITAASMKFRIFWDVAPCSHVEVDWRFRGAYCLHHYSSPWWWSIYLWNVSKLPSTTRRYIPKDSKLQHRLCSWWWRETVSPNCGH